MAIYNTLANKAATFRLYAEEFLSNQFFSNPDLDNSGGEDFSTYNATFKPTTIVVRISSAPDAYTKA